MMKIKDAIREFVLNRFGISAKFAEVLEEIDSLHYFLNEFVDITNIPPTKNAQLRILQETDALLLAIFHKLCDRYGISYWLDFGTLLGSIRHKGFVPWDDDMDVSMLRDDCNKILEIFPPLLKKYNLCLYTEIDRLCFHYRHFETGIWLDVFPFDQYNMTSYDEDTQYILSNKINEYHKYFMEYLASAPNMSLEKLSILKNKIVGDGEGDVIVYWHPVFYKYYYFNRNDIFPLKQSKFEERIFNIPNNYEHILKTYYGNYLTFPKRGILHHGESSGRSPLHEWANLHGVNMENVKEELLSIYEKI